MRLGTARYPVTVFLPIKKVERRGVLKLRTHKAVILLIVWRHSRRAMPFCFFAAVHGSARPVPLPFITKK